MRVASRHTTRLRTLEWESFPGRFRVLLGRLGPERESAVQWSAQRPLRSRSKEAPPARTSSAPRHADFGGDLSDLRPISFRPPCPFPCKAPAGNTENGVN